MTHPAAVRLNSIQALRGLAAVSVALQHNNNYVINRALSDPDLAQTAFFVHHFGAFGVDLFFVISGFLMYWLTASAPTAQAAQASFSQVSAFWMKRIIRIVPLYWLLTTAFIGGMMWMSESWRFTMNQPDGWWFALCSYLFLPGVSPLGSDNIAVLGQGWTLVYEMFFYAVFGLTLLAPAQRRFGLLATVLIGLVGLGWISSSDNVVVRTYTDSLLLEFLGGALIAKIYCEMPIRQNGLGLALLAAGLAACLPSVLLGPDIAPRAIVWGLPAVLMVAGAVFHEASRPDLRLPRFLIEVGNCTYSLYLSHAFILKAAELAKSPSRLDADLVVGILLAAQLVLAWLIYRLIELPITERLNTAYKSHRNAVRNAAAHSEAG